MKPIGPLMREHRLIERMVKMLNQELGKLVEINTANTDFLRVAIDFLRTYVEKTHHGKEEDILFKELGKKQLSEQHRNMMNQLIEEHTAARNTTSTLANAVINYTEGRTESIKEMISCIGELVDLYANHIEKEDKHFFYPSLEYLGNKEQEDMLVEFFEFDRKLIHEKYENMVSEAEKIQSGSLTTINVQKIH